MSAFRDAALRTKLLLVILCTTLAAVTAALGAMVAYDLRAYRQTAMADMATQAELIGHTLVPALAFDDAKVARENLALLRLRPEIQAAAIYNARGELFASYVGRGRAIVPPARPGEDGVEVEGRDFVLFRRIVHNAEPAGTVYLRADYRVHERILHYGGIAGVVALAAMLIAFLMSSRLQALVTAPILDIAAVARRVVTSQNYAGRARKTTLDEVGALADSFNDMLAEVERRAAHTDAANRQLQLEVGERQRSELEIARLNGELGDRVRIRTAQLEASNRELAAARKEAERANRAKSEFLSSMSHELRTPLNAILGFGQILASRSMPTTPTQEKEFAGQIVKAGKHLLELINEVLDLAKIESGNVSLSLEPVALGELMAECRMMTEPLARQFGVRMTFLAKTDLWAVGDRTRLTQIILNLLSNAIKYNQDNGAVVVSTSLSDDGRVRVKVDDTGHGLRADQLAALFQPFNRLGQEGSAVEGTGIGLIVTRKLVELMGGTIGVTSTVGTGTTFWVDFERAPATAVRPNSVGMAPPVPAKSAPAAERTVLYLEDNPASLRVVEEMIRFRPGLKLLTAPDATLGLALARAHLPDVILMDIDLPGMDGIEALGRLQSSRQTARIPVIAITASGFNHQASRGKARGFFRTLTKPLDLDQFAEALDSALATADVAVPAARGVP